MLTSSKSAQSPLLALIWTIAKDGLGGLITWAVLSALAAYFGGELGRLASPVIGYIFLAMFAALTIRRVRDFFSGRRQGGDGDGGVDPTNWPPGTVRMPCPQGNDGKTMCFGCSGNGQIRTALGFDQCPNCAGHGRLYCTKCKGTGYVDANA